ncbi:MAG: hypothetical protein C4293_07970 [Nitrospiraceae bacterium]
MRPIKIVGLGGSLRAPSSSLAALKIALEGAAEAGAHTQVLDVRTLNLPIYVHTGDDVSAAFSTIALRYRVRSGRTDLEQSSVPWHNQWIV